VPLLDSARAIIVASCWFSLAIIASVYMFVFGDKLGDILFGVLIPIGLLVLAGMIVTLVLAENSKQ
jgi:hypothetical protein